MATELVFVELKFLKSWSSQLTNDQKYPSPFCINLYYQVYSFIFENGSVGQVWDFSGYFWYINLKATCDKRLKVVTIITFVFSSC